MKWVTLKSQGLLQEEEKKKKGCKEGCGIKADGEWEGQEGGEILNNFCKDSVAGRRVPKPRE